MLVEFLIHTMHISNQTLILFSILIHQSFHCLCITYYFSLVLFVALCMLFYLFQLASQLLDYSALILLFHAVEGCQLSDVMLKFRLQLRYLIQQELFSS